MLKLTENQHGAAATERALRFCGIRLGPFEAAASARARIKAHRVALRDRREEYAEALEQRIAATVEIEYRDKKVDRRVIALAGVMRPTLSTSEAGRAALKAALPSAPSDALKGVNDPSQSRFVENLCQQLQANVALAAWKDEAAALRGLVADTDEGVTAREALYVSEGQARTQLRLAIARAQRDYNLAFAELTLAFPDDDDLVESFFWRATRSSDAAETPPPPDEPA